MAGAITRALETLAAGAPARYQPTRWGEEERKPVQIETARDLRLKRGLERDGENARAQWEQWMEEG
ncbi:MAG TPA: hypothetical protein VNB46_00545 [Gaiellaceae bacterium]|nr:hypothetical protein [Gaiellaceae bacterium]